MTHYLITKKGYESWVIMIRGFFRYHKFNDKTYETSEAALKEFNEIINGVGCIIKIED